MTLIDRRSSHDQVSTAVSGPFIDTEIPHSIDGQRLDRVVSMLAGCSRSVASGLIDSGAVTLDGVVVTRTAHRVRTGDHLRIEDGPDVDETVLEADPTVSFTVVSEDEHLVVVDKPAGLVVHPGAGNPDRTLVNGLLARYPSIASVGDPVRPGIVHRLDVGTSGLMVVARTEESYEALVEAMAQRRVHRRYTALVGGHPAHARGVIDAPIGRSRRDPLRMTVTSDGREARTHYRVEQEYDQPFDAALLRCDLETGRTHQIRVHLSEIGHPVVGDTRYGGRPTSLERPFLHARELSFTHPITGDEISVTSDLPADLAGLLEEFSPLNPATDGHPR